MTKHRISFADAEIVASRVVNYGTDYQPEIMLQAYNLLMASTSPQAPYHWLMADKLMAKRPGIMNFDEDGNWVGVVRGENGWAA